MNDAFYTCLTDKPNCTLKFKLTNVTEIIDIINKLKPKSSSGVDELSNKVIKHIQPKRHRITREDSGENLLRA